MKIFVIFSLKKPALHYRLMQIAGLLWHLFMKKAYLLFSKPSSRVQTGEKRCYCYPLTINEVRNTPSFDLPTPQLRIQIPIGNASASPVLDLRGFLHRVL